MSSTEFGDRRQRLTMRPYLLLQRTDGSMLQACPREPEVWSENTRVCMPHKQNLESWVYKPARVRVLGTVNKRGAPPSKHCLLPAMCKVPLQALAGTGSQFRARGTQGGPWKMDEIWLKVFPGAGGVSWAGRKQESRKQLSLKTKVPQQISGCGTCHLPGFSEYGLPESRLGYLGSGDTRGLFNPPAHFYLLILSC